ncbi:MAG: hypothetical protein K6G28_06050 [Acholeplasmatales bacterium]|nr:hypothetical protein [Acholeplasmatales bacterium]
MNNIVTKVYKPEIEKCPICGSKLAYRYTVSNKIIQFSSGNKSRIKNLGYSCVNQDCPASDVIFTSQTASKFCIKGYTYSAKVIALITILKNEGYSREKICAELALLGVEISDRNIDNIYEREKALLSADYKKNIETEYEFMANHYGQIRLSIDSLTINGKRVVSIRESFHNHQIGLHLFDEEDTESVKKILHEYVDDKRITCITTVRKMTDFFKILDKVVNRDMEYHHFIKY